MRDFLLFPSQATILTLSTFTRSVTSRNSTSFRTNVHTLSQNLYVFSDPCMSNRKTIQHTHRKQSSNLYHLLWSWCYTAITKILTLKLTLLRTRLASAVLMALSNCSRTCRANCGVICWVWRTNLKKIGNTGCMKKPVNDSWDLKVQYKLVCVFYNII